MAHVSPRLKVDVTVPAEGGIELGAWLFLPDGDGLHPAITMAHGFAGTREHRLERFAQAFAAAGFVVLLHGGDDVLDRIGHKRQIFGPRPNSTYHNGDEPSSRPAMKP